MTIDWDYKLERVVNKYVGDIFCNCCGESCKADHGQGHHYAEIVAHWGYGSKKDLKSHRAHLCESCFDKLIKTFVEPPEEVEQTVVGATPEFENACMNIKQPSSE